MKALGYSVENKYDTGKILKGAVTGLIGGVIAGKLFGGSKETTTTARASQSQTIENTVTENGVTAHSFAGIGVTAIATATAKVSSSIGVLGGGIIGAVAEIVLTEIYAAM